MLGAGAVGVTRPHDHGTSFSDIVSDEDMKHREIRQIVGVAINYRDTGRIFVLPRPYRHHHVIMMAVDLGEEMPITGTQGFVLDDGAFVMRKAARRLAVQSGQAPNPNHPALLFSEDLW